MMNCPNCKRTIQKDAKFCRYCGTVIKKRRYKIKAFLMVLVAVLVIGGFVFGKTLMRPSDVQMTSGNYLGRGQAVQWGNWIYFVNVDYRRDAEHPYHIIFRVHPDGSNEEVVYENNKIEDISNLQVIDGTLFFMERKIEEEPLYTGQICKLNDNGKKTVLEKNVAQFFSDGNKLYFTYFVDGWEVELYSADLDGTDQRRIADEKNSKILELVGLENGWLYYHEEVTRKTEQYNLCKVRLDGTEKKEILDSGNYVHCIIDNGVILAFDKRRIVKKEEGKELVEVITFNEDVLNPAAINCKGDFVYYTISNGKGDSLYRIKKDGTQNILLTKLENSEIIENLMLFDDCVIYSKNTLGGIYPGITNGGYLATIVIFCDEQGRTLFEKEADMGD